MCTDPSPEREAVARVTADGRTRIPEEIRDAVGVDAPGRVRFRLTADGDVLVLPVPSAHDLAGAFGESECERPLSALLREERERERAEDEARVERLREASDSDET